MISSTCASKSGITKMRDEEEDGAPEEGLGRDRGVGVDHVAPRRTAGVPLVEKRAACSTGLPF